MKDNKKEHKDKIKAFKKQEEKEILSSLPFAENLFRDLFDYLDKELGLTSCQHDFRLTSEFLKSKEIDFNQNIGFFIDNSAGCDCEVLANVEEIFPEVIRKDILFVSNQINKEKLSHLKLPNFELENIPAPWKLFKIGTNYEFHLGKNNNIKIIFISGINYAEWTNESYWQSEWESITELKVKSEQEVIHEEFGEVEMVTFKTKDWIPVLTWIKPKQKAWNLLFRTELSRVRGDMNELRNLLNRIK